MYPDSEEGEILSYFQIKILQIYDCFRKETLKIMSHRISADNDHDQNSTQGQREHQAIY